MSKFSKTLTKHGPKNDVSSGPFDWRMSKINEFITVDGSLEIDSEFCISDNTLIDAVSRSDWGQLLLSLSESSDIVGVFDLIGIKRLFLPMHKKKFNEEWICQSDKVCWI